MNFLNERDSTIICGDCLDVMNEIETSSVNLIISDWPYYKVKAEDWDHQWSSVEEYLDWIGLVCESYQRTLAPNGSLYAFASPKMAARVEIKLSEYFNMLNRITWRKGKFDTKAEMFPKDALCSFFPVSEIVFFAEHCGADRISPFAEIMNENMQRMNLSQHNLSTLELSRTGNRTGWIHNKLMGIQIPTKGQWQKLCQAFAIEDKYDALLQEYENLRRPFNVTIDDQYTDVWDFPTVKAYPGKHPCEKPLEMMEHIIKVSSKPGDLVADFFCGSGATAEAALQLGRGYFCCDIGPRWANYSKRRVEKARLKMSQMELTL